MHPHSLSLCLIAPAVRMMQCQPPSLNLPPPAETVLLHIQSTTATAPLLRDLARPFLAGDPVDSTTFLARVQEANAACQPTGS